MFIAGLIANGKDDQLAFAVHQLNCATRVFFMLLSRYRTILAIFCGAILLQACTILPQLEEPGITVNTVELLDSTGLSQRFKIGLLLTNPNSVALPIKGM